ncbi:MAG: HvfC family RiPP maturation protein [Methylococcales bacterium]
MQAPELLRQQQFALSKHIRDPENNSPPPEIEDRRLAIYRDLFYNNIEGLLAGNFPVIREILDDDTWHELVHAFYREHLCQTHLFPEVPREFIRFLETRMHDNAGDPAWLMELAHYEWVELALDLAENDDSENDIVIKHENILDTAFNLSPLSWPLGYQWPVHRLSPGYLPDETPDAPTFLLVRRDHEYKVHFDEISALIFRLLELISDTPELTAKQQLTALALEANADDLESFIDLGLGLYQNLIDQRTLRPTA